MADCCATFRVQSKSLFSKDITERLRLMPTTSFDKGSAISERRPELGLRDQTLWLLKSTLQEEKDLHEHLIHILSQIESRASEIERLKTDACDMDIRCMCSSDNGQAGFILDSIAINRLNKLSLDLVIDLFPPT